MNIGTTNFTFNYRCLLFQAYSAVIPGFSLHLLLYGGEESWVKLIPFMSLYHIMCTHFQVGIPPSLGHLIVRIMKYG